MHHYHYIFAGGGLAALMTLRQMAISGQFRDKSILVIDSDTKTTNDRTWCFWEKPGGEWEDVAAKQWDSALFQNDQFTRILELAPYRYKMIMGIDLYNNIRSTLASESNMTFLTEYITGTSESGNMVNVQTENASYSCDKLFNSIIDIAAVLHQARYPLLQQHFIGWFIKSKQPVFTPDCATFMDFSVPQIGNTRFMYVLPFSENEALVEYTLFSKSLLTDSEYEEAIKAYISELGISDFEIVEKERGSIPMTSYPFWKHDTKNIINIGSAGGWTKASTGFTFKNTQKKSAELVSFLQTNDDLAKFHKSGRFWFYDLLLLDILSEKNHLGNRIFSALFKKGKPPLIFKFLDEETSIAEDLKVILKCPKALFIAALLKRIRN